MLKGLLSGLQKITELENRRLILKLLGPDRTARVLSQLDPWHSVYLTMKAIKL